MKQREKRGKKGGWEDGEIQFDKYEQMQETKFARNGACQTLGWREGKYGFRLDD